MVWKPLRARVQRSRSSTKKKGTSPEFAGFCLLAVSALGLFCLIAPQQSGVAGLQVARALSRAFGRGGFLLWALLGYRGFRLITQQENRQPWRYFIVDGLLLWSACALLSTFGSIFIDSNPGGFLGKASTQTLTTMFGRWGALFVSCSSLGAVLLWRTNRHPGDVAHWAWNRLVQDWKEWRQAVAFTKQKSAEPDRKKALPKLKNAESPNRPLNEMSDGKPAGAFRQEISRPVVSIPVPSIPVKPMPSTPKPVAPKSEIPVNPDSESMEPAAPPYELPSLEILKAGEKNPFVAKEEDLLASAHLLEQTLATFGVDGKVVEIHPGPIITRFDFAPAPGIKVQAVAALSNDIAMAMRALSVRILAPIPGKAAVGIELPNPKRAIVRLREIFESEGYQNPKGRLTLGLGKDGEGRPYASDLAGMPHMLIGGSTGSGKSVCIHALIMSIIFRNTPQQVKLVMIDPKRVELPLYNEIPYLFDPNQNPENCRVITDAKEASKALDGMVRVMDHRFKKFASVMARDIIHYNEKMEAEGRPTEPYIVVIIDELADMMAVAPKDVETSIQRLTQMARAVGIHMVLATQRPSVDVITGVIKANLPARMAFRVASQIDSRVILDSAGAESLLGEGDMLFLPPGAPKPIRLQCGFVTSAEVQAVADYARSQGKPMYERILNPITGGSSSSVSSTGNEELDDLHQALMLVLERRRVSQDLLKAHFGSSARATNLLSMLEIKGFIAKPEGTNRWTIYFDRIDNYLGQLKNQAPVS